MSHLKIKQLEGEASHLFLTAFIRPGTLELVEDLASGKKMPLF